MNIFGVVVEIYVWKAKIRVADLHLYGIIAKNKSRRVHYFLNTTVTELSKSI